MPFLSMEIRECASLEHKVVEICAGAGGQALGLERAGFRHALAVELDHYPAATLSRNRPRWKVAHGDVADPAVWDPDEYPDVSLLAGGVPCPPFSIAGKQLGSADERDLFAWAVELCVRMRPKALMLENVRGLSMPRFAAYRQAVLDRLSEVGYVADWKLLQASDYGVPQLRPRFVLVALRTEDAPYFQWPEHSSGNISVGEALRELMGSNGWIHAMEWANAVTGIAPTIVGGSKKHGGADLGPTRVKRAWREMHVDAMGVADHAPSAVHPHFSVKPPRLTVEMVARLQGWDREANWAFVGGKTAQYRQIGNAFPPPIAEAVGRSIKAALEHKSEVEGARQVVEHTIHDDVYRALREARDFLAIGQLLERLTYPYAALELERRIDNLDKDFIIEKKITNNGIAYRLGEFKAFVGQANHHRHLAFTESTTRSKIS
ncbi:DNA cytosine methyltransferase [Kocuria rosea]|uniref:DNA cytosine methyltransferase n=1 Tax=Kocuria rosea TaxID=1275 RepID=UPI0025B75045|nr:DNA (cytosine-5-)-methyltransferase [Kocuria rosea]WJZ66665.1 DNA (cytosine-5-)-methyltransferase [Kocuria rosea]